MELERLDSEGLEGLLTRCHGVRCLISSVLALQIEPAGHYLERILSVRPFLRVSAVFRRLPGFSDEDGTTFHFAVVKQQSVFLGFVLSLILLFH